MNAKKQRMNISISKQTRTSIENIAVKRKMKMSAIIECGVKELEEKWKNEL